MLEDEVIVISDSDSEVIKRPISKKKNKSIILISSEDDDDKPVIKERVIIKGKRLSSSSSSLACKSSSSLDSLKGFGTLNIKTNETAPSSSSYSSSTSSSITVTNKHNSYLKLLLAQNLKDPLAVSYESKFKDCKQEILNECFVIFNESVFENKLPKDTKLIWNSKLTSSGGYCKKIIRNKKPFVEIHISVKVCDKAERMRDTLIHEMCHAAAFLIEGLLKDGHGPAWQKWTAVANSKYKKIPLITRCHSYTTEKKFIYRCQECKYEFHRNRRSIDISKYSCGNCKKGKFLIVENEKAIKPAKEKKNSKSESNVKQTNSSKL